MPSPSADEHSHCAARGPLTECAGAPPTSTRAVPDRFVGRQPIVDERCRLFGYELLYREGAAQAFSGDPNEATREVIDYWLMLPHPDRSRIFLNCTRSSLTQGVVRLLRPETVVLEILETLEPDAELLECCHALRKDGYRFALDDFTPEAWRMPFLPLADFIKIDFLACSRSRRRAIYDMAAGHAARYIAEKIETKEEMLAAQTEGCSLFQGYFFARPIIVPSRRIPQNHFVYLRLMAALSQAPADLDAVEKLVISDASLSYRLLRLSNSALMGLTCPVTSVRSALLFVGEDALRRMVTVALAGALAGHRSPALLSMALVRARFCELLAPALAEPPGLLHLLGLFSLLDALLDAPMPQILSALPIDCEMKAALVGNESPRGLALRLVRGFELCDWAACETLCRRLGLAESQGSALYVESLHWAAAMLELQATDPASPPAGETRASL